MQKLRDENVTLQKETDTQIKSSIELTDSLAKANGDRSVLKERNEQLTLDVDNATRLLKGLGMSIKDPSDASKIPVVGIITAVSHSKVEISIGVDDGVRIGQELDIYRGDKYVGRVKVVEAQPRQRRGHSARRISTIPHSARRQRRQRIEFQDY